MTLPYDVSRCHGVQIDGFARQRWRARIETIVMSTGMGRIRSVRPPEMAGAD